MGSTGTVGSHAAFGAACVVCCGLPMLVVLGVVSLGTAAVGGVAVGSVLWLGGVGYLVARKRVGSFPPMVSRGLGLAGLAVGGVGIWLGATGSVAAPAALSLAVAILGTALLVRGGRGTSEGEVGATAGPRDSVVTGR